MPHHEGATAMADDGQTPYLYVQETAYFGFYPLRFTDRLIDHANDTIYTTAERFRTLLDSSSGSTLISPWQMEEAMLKLLTLLESAIDKNFDIFELYCLKNILKFPASLRAFNEMQVREVVVAILAYMTALFTCSPSRLPRMMNSVRQLCCVSAKSSSRPSCFTLSSSTSGRDF